MGLDMFLLVAPRGTEKFEEVAYWRKANQIFNWFDKRIDGGVEDCVRHLVSKEDLEELRDLCKTILDKTEVVGTGNYRTSKVIAERRLVNEKVEVKMLVSQIDLASALPTTDGFFFGSTDYDERYLEEVAYTYDRLEALLGADTAEKDNDCPTIDFDKEQVVFYAWW